MEVENRNLIFKVNQHVFMIIFINRKILIRYNNLLQFLIIYHQDL